MRLTIALLFVLVAGMQADAPPKLSDTQRLLLQNRVLALRVAQLELQAYVSELKAVCTVDLDTLQCASNIQ